MSITRTRTFLASMMLAATVASATHAQDTAPYTLDGKVIRVVLSTTAGGNADAQTRLLADYLARYLPGNPTLVVQNLNGGDGALMMQFVAQLDPAVDLVLYNVANSMPARALTGLFDLNLFDPRTTNWIGGFRGTTQFCIVSTKSGIETIDDLRNGERHLFAAASVGGAANAMYTLMNQALGLNIETVAGYDSFGSQVLAVQRGEVDGMCNNYSAYKTLVRPAVEAGDVKFIFYLGGSGHRDDITDAPFIGDLVPPESMTFFNAAISAILFGGPYAVPPGTDPRFVDAMREAFANVMADPEFQAAAEDYGVDLLYETPDMLAAHVDALFAMTPEEIEQIGHILGD